MPLRRAVAAMSELNPEDLFDLPDTYGRHGLEMDSDSVVVIATATPGQKDDMGGTPLGEKDAGNGMVLNAVLTGPLSDFEVCAEMSTSTSGSSESDRVDSGIESETMNDVANFDEVPPLSSPHLRNSRVKRKSIALGDLNTAEQQQRQIVLHSPGTLLNTPMDASRRYEYPFPAPTASPTSETGSTDGYAASSSASVSSGSVDAVGLGTPHSPGTPGSWASSPSMLSPMGGVDASVPGPLSPLSSPEELPAHLSSVTAATRPEPDSAVLDPTSASASGSSTATSFTAKPVTKSKSSLMSNSRTVSGTPPILAALPVPIPKLPPAIAAAAAARRAQAASQTSHPHRAPKTLVHPHPYSSAQSHSHSHSQSQAPSQPSHAHPKLSKFNPADTPVPPSLRGLRRRTQPHMNTQWVRAVIAAGAGASATAKPTTVKTTSDEAGARDAVNGDASL